MRYVWAPCTFGVVSKCGKVVVRDGACCCAVCFTAFPNTFCLCCVMSRRTFVWSGSGVETWLCIGGGALQEESGSWSDAFGFWDGGYWGFESSLGRWMWRKVNLLEGVWLVSWVVTILVRLEVDTFHMFV